MISACNARRIASASLLQFITHPEFFQKGLPSLGFYGPFEPGVQSYSCSGSPYWMFLNYAALTLPQEHPFWNVVEEEGHWKSIPKNGLESEFFKGPGMLISNHGTSGSS